MTNFTAMGIGAVDVGGTKIDTSLVSLAGRVLASRSRPTRLPGGPDKALADIEVMLRACEAEAGTPIMGTGIGCTGPVEPTSGVVGAVDLLPGWEGFPLADRLSKALGTPVVLENDADAGALGEARWGGGNGATRFLYVSIGTGIGVGIVINGQLYRGAAGAHPELGHHTIDASGPACYCGATGCWESLASGTAMEVWAESAWDVANSGSKPHKDLSGRSLVEMARNGDAFALSVIERESRYIGIGLANLVTCFCPDRVVLGGGLMAGADLLLAPAIVEMRTRCGLVPIDNVSVTTAKLGKNAALIGAAQSFIHRYPQYGNSSS